MKEFETKLKSKELDYFFTAILNIKDIEECYRFFEDVSTISELKALCQRFQVAKMLREKKTYIEIGEVTGASTATISRVNRCLNYGSNWYNTILDRLEVEEKEQ